MTHGYPFRTLPDYLRPRLRLVFVGINPSVYSVERGRYFARTTNRFWPAFSRSRLSAPIRTALGRSALGPDDDRGLLRFGIGFTDVVKTPSRNAAALRPKDFDTWAPRLRQRLARVAPRVVCFHGITAYRAFARYALDSDRRDWTLGAQPIGMGSVRLYVIPNPSPANAHFPIAALVEWYDRLAAFLEDSHAAGHRSVSARISRRLPM